jgi:hypothetical protein
VTEGAQLRDDRIHLWLERWRGQQSRSDGLRQLPDERGTLGRPSAGEGLSSKTLVQ